MPREVKDRPKELHGFCPCCRKVVKFILKGYVKVCQRCGSVGEID